MADDTPDSWVTIEEVANVTGETVTEKDITKARGIIEVQTGVLQDQFPKLWGRDRTWLARAVAYQAAFMVEHPDLFSLLDADSVSQDGQGMSGRGAWLTLAPLAKSSIRRLSWKGTHSTRALAPGENRASDFDEVDRQGRPLQYRPLS